MFLGKVIGDADSDENTGEANTSRLKVVQKLDLYRNPSGPSSLAVDCIGADDGDIVIVGTPSASERTPLPHVPEMPGDSMIMGILDSTRPGHVKRRPTAR